MRLDKFLKVSRLIKRRTIACNACDSKRIIVNGEAKKPSYIVKVGDEIEINMAQSVKVKVNSLKETTRKDEASEMYTII